jgi:6-phosphofructokinase 1
MRIAISTGGGDAPGLNAVIHAATREATRLGHHIVGIEDGFAGLLAHDRTVALDEVRVRGIERTAGTILGAASSGKPFGPDGSPEILCERLRAHGIDALVMAGGDGTLRIAGEVARSGFPVVCVPKTIDRDVPGTHSTFGFQTAVDVATENIQRLHATAESHRRLMVAEVMGRDAGWIALHAGLACSADMIAIPELPFSLDIFAAHAQRLLAGDARHLLLVCAEGAYPEGGQVHRCVRTGQLGGIGEVLASELSARVGIDARHLSLGHLLRGGAPSAYDRILGMRFGAAAIQALLRGESAVMCAYVPPQIITVPIAMVAGRLHPIAPGHPDLRLALSMGISLGI